MGVFISFLLYITFADVGTRSSCHLNVAIYVPIKVFMYAMRLFLYWSSKMLQGMGTGGIQNIDGGGMGGNVWNWNCNFGILDFSNFGISIHPGDASLCQLVALLVLQYPVVQGYIYIFFALYNCVHMSIHKILMFFQDWSWIFPKSGLWQVPTKTPFRQFQGSKIPHSHMWMEYRGYFALFSWNFKTQKLLGVSCVHIPIIGRQVILKNELLQIFERSRNVHKNVHSSNVSGHQNLNPFVSFLKFYVKLLALFQCQPTK